MTTLQAKRTACELILSWNEINYVALRPPQCALEQMLERVLATFTIPSGLIFASLSLRTLFQDTKASEAPMMLHGQSIQANEAPNLETNNNRSAAYARTLES